MLLNLPWSLLGFLGALLSLPINMRFDKFTPALIFQIKTFWWLEHIPGKKGVRGTTAGNIVLLGKTLDNDLEHELIHVEQHMREPFIHPLLYIIEACRHGYRKNKYETEAYSKAGNKYLEKPL